MLDQAIHASVAGLTVAVAAPPVAVTPVSDGIEKNVAAQAAGVVDAMVASLVKVTVNGLPVWPLAATVSGVLKVCEVPLVAVAKFQPTPLGVAARHPVWVVVNALVV